MIHPLQPVLVVLRIPAIGKGAETAQELLLELAVVVLVDLDGRGPRAH